LPHDAEESTHEARRSVSQPKSVKEHSPPRSRIQKLAQARRLVFDDLPTPGYGDSALQSTGKSGSSKDELASLERKRNLSVRNTDFHFSLENASTGQTPVQDIADSRIGLAISSASGSGSSPFGLHASRTPSRPATNASKGHLMNASRTPSGILSSSPTNLRPTASTAHDRADQTMFVSEANSSGDESSVTSCDEDSRYESDQSIGKMASGMSWN